MSANIPIAAALDPGVRIGHVHLKVAELERALEFYCGVLGFELTQRYGTQAAFIVSQKWPSLVLASPMVPKATSLPLSLNCV